METHILSKYESSRKHTHFPVILSKMPIKELLIRDRKIFALFEWEGVNFIVVNAHLNQFGRNKKMRKLEIDMIGRSLISLHFNINCKRDHTFIYIEQNLQM